MAQVIQLESRAGDDGVLHLSIPVEKTNADYEVVVVLQPKSTEPQPVVSGSLWPPGFIEQTAGAWQGELAREPQGEYENREEF